MIKIAICDDCKQDIEKLETMLLQIMNKYSIPCNIKKYENGESLLDMPLAFHLIFLDIIMDGKSGIEIGKQIYRKNKSVKIVYQTNFNEYWRGAINQSHAFAFLEKPIQSLALEEQIKEFLESSNKMQEIRVEFRNVRVVSDARKEVKPLINLPVMNILYFEYVKREKKIEIVTDEETYLYAETMNKLQERMIPLGFEVCCRGILINLERIKKIKGYNVILDNGSIMPLSQRRVIEFKERLNEYIHDSFS